VNKAIAAVIGVLAIVAAGSAAFIMLPQDPVGPTEPGEPTLPQDPLVISAPVASNILVGQANTESTLTGEFSVPGDLNFTGIIFISYGPGTAECDWEFVPDDLTLYNKLTGKVTVHIFESKIIFNENGGFELDDIYFNGTYILSERLITAKNEYRFDDWSTIDGTASFITYPFTVSATTNLYAQYTYHTAEKVSYAMIYSSGTPTGKILAGALWGSNGIPEKPYALRPWDPPVAGSIAGEVVIADMYDGMPVTRVGNFGHTNITGIVFPNFIEFIGSFEACSSLGPELVIPNTVKEIRSEAFQNCSSLERVIFEDGDGFINLGSIIFYESGLKEVHLHRVDTITSWMFAYCKIEEVFIPAEVTVIQSFAFAGSPLKKVTIEEDSRLTSISNCAFARCLIDEISVPAAAHVAPDAFRGCSSLMKINITDEQINNIAKELHDAYIGPADDFTILITRDARYGGMNFEGEYVANTETINLRFEYFSIFVLDALVHEFFHHYQYVLVYGVGSEDFNSVPVYVSKYSRYSIFIENPYIIVANKNVLFDEFHPGAGLLYEWAVNYCEGLNRRYILIDDVILDEWRQPYIYPEVDWDLYWDQPWEADARAFASWFSGVFWQK